MTVEGTDGVLTNNIALLFLQSERKRSAHILVYQLARRMITAKTGETGSYDQYKEYYDGILLFHLSNQDYLDSGRAPHEGSRLGHHRQKHSLRGRSVACHTLRVQNL